MAFAFNGTNQYISSLSSPIGSSPATWSISARVKAAAIASRCVLSFGNSGNNNPYIILYSNPGGSLARFAIRNDATSGANQVDLAAGTIFDNTWHQIGASWDGTTARLFVDGLETASVSPSPLGAITLDRFFIGSRVRTSGADLYLPGDVADIGIWTATLNADQMASLGKAISPGQIRPQSLVTDISLIRNLQDVRNGLSITNNNGATVVDHPRLFQ